MLDWSQPAASIVRVRVRSVAPTLLVFLASGLHDDEPFSAQLVPDSTLADSIRVQPSERGWDVSLPGSWFDRPAAVFYLVEVCWRGILLNHSDLGHATFGSW